MNERYKFSVDWFSNNISRWQTYVVPYLKSLPGPIKCLEVGVYEGRSALWTVEQCLLKNPASQIWLVDTWTRKGSWKAFLKNLSLFKEYHPKVRQDKLVVCRGEYAEVLRSPELSDQQFDFIYLDLHGDSKDMIETAVHAWPLLKPGGMLVFDDYTSSQEHDGACMKQGIDAFLDLYAYDLKVEHMSWQVIVRKREQKLKRAKGCFSEYYV